MCLRTPVALDNINNMIKTSNVVNYGLKFLLSRFSDSLSVILDSDMFMVAPWSVREYLRGYHIAGPKQIRGSGKDAIKYLSIHLLAFNFATLPEVNSIDLSHIAATGRPNADCGGKLADYFLVHPQIRIRNVRHTSHIGRGHRNLFTLPPEAVDTYEDSFEVELYEKAFLHYGSGSGWKNGVYAEMIDHAARKTQWVQWLLNETARGSFRIPDHSFVAAVDVWSLG